MITMVRDYSNFERVRSGALLKVKQKTKKKLKKKDLITYALLS